MANEDTESKTNTTPAYLFGLFMIILGAIAVGIFVAILVINKEKLSIERAKDYPREDNLEIEYRGND